LYVLFQAKKKMPYMIPFSNICRFLIHFIVSSSYLFRFRMILAVFFAFLSYIFQLASL